MTIRKLVWRLTGLGLVLVLLVACTPQGEPTLTAWPPPGMGLLAAKKTQSAGLTAQPSAPPPSEAAPSATPGWTPQPGEVTAADSGKSFNLGITSRMSIILEESLYPQANLKMTCDAPQVLGQVSNIPAVPAGYYVMRYEGVGLGTCNITNGSFDVTITVKAHP